MGFIVGLLAILALIVLTICYVILVNFIDILRVAFGYRHYEYTKILSHGMKEFYEWHKTDDIALERHKNCEFVSMVRPHNKRLKPLK